MKKEYIRLKRIPGGIASERLVEGCLVLEGGAFRGLYTQGFTDAMMKHDLNLSCVIGVSAGALCGMNYVSGQIGRSARVNLKYRHDRRYVGTKALLNSGSFLDVSFLTEDRGIFKEPFNQERFDREEQRFVAVATSVTTGAATYFEKGHCSDIMAAVRASATMPYISPAVEIDGEAYLDGGCSCKIPYEWALEQGYKKIVVIKTRENGFRKPEKMIAPALTMYKNHAEFSLNLATSNFTYNKQCDEIERLEAEGRLKAFAPSKPVTVSRIERDVNALGDLYWLGYRDACEQMEELKEYLGA